MRRGRAGVIAAMTDRVRLLGARSRRGEPRLPAHEDVAYASNIATLEELAYARVRRGRTSELRALTGPCGRLPATSLAAQPAPEHADALASLGVRAERRREHVERFAARPSRAKTIGSEILEMSAPSDRLRPPSRALDDRDR
jgi:hypothetical protein